MPDDLSTLPFSFDNKHRVRSDRERQVVPILRWKIRNNTICTLLHPVGSVRLSEFRREVLICVSEAFLLEFLLQLGFDEEHVEEHRDVAAPESPQTE